MKSSQKLTVRYFYLAAITLAVLVTTCAWAPSALGDVQFERPQVHDDGSIDVPGFALPFSSLASPEAKAAFIKRKQPAVFAMPNASIGDVRKTMNEEIFYPMLAKQNARYSVSMQERTIGGVFTQIFTPKKGVALKNRNRVLINVHGGGFTQGGLVDSQVESIPISAVGEIQVISIDYRMAPENHFPAASEDVAAVYKEVLKTHKPSEVAIYGCSAGGMLAGESIAWFQKENLPNPAAIGVFCASLIAFSGDSVYVSPRLGGALPPPSKNDSALSVTDAYFNGADPKDPLVSPGNSASLLAKFPPTLLITGTRAGELSSAVRSHIELVKAGVDARLFVWEAMDHGFFLDPDLPESREAYDIIAKFFDEEMDKTRR